MHSILVKRVDDALAGEVSVLAQDVSTSVDAWSIAENIAASYDRHGIDRAEMVFRFHDAAGLHHIWAEQARAVSAAAPLSERIATLLFDGRHSPCSARHYRQEALPKAA